MMREKLIIVGLYLAKFGKQGVQALGFSNFKETYNTLGFLFGGNPNAIKNYRDEFDPLLPNNRQGWHKRPIRDYCLFYFEQYKNFDFLAFTRLVLSFIPDYEIETLLIEDAHTVNATAKRLATGYAAEEYFKIHYQTIPMFEQFQLCDYTQRAVGFDYKLSNNANTYYVEVKGLNEARGNILFTDKEYNMAHSLANNYCLFVVSNFREEPHHQIIFNPINSHLSFVKKTQIITHINYTVKW